jgi:hypothetical protein
VQECDLGVPAAGHAAPIGQVFRDRVVEPRLAALDGDGEQERREDLGHRADLEHHPLGRALRPRHGTGRCDGRFGAVGCAGHQQPRAPPGPFGRVAYRLFESHVTDHTSRGHAWGGSIPSRAARDSSAQTVAARAVCAPAETVMSQ